MAIARAPYDHGMRHVVVCGFEGVQSLDLTGPLEVFATATRSVLGPTHRDRYETLVASFDGQPFRTSSGVQIIPDVALHRLRRAVHTLIVPGGTGVHAQCGDAKTCNAVRRAAERSERTGSVCTGAFLLARTGLLDGHRATTHWAFADAFREAYPQVSLDEDAIFTAQEATNGTIWTSAGVTAGIDMALAMVEEDHGREVALATARRLVVFVKRPGGQSQFSAQLAGQFAEHDQIRDLQSWIAENPSADLRLQTMAARVHMSVRHFSRVFLREVGLTPASFVERSRADAARRYLEDTHLSLEQVAAACGFDSSQRLRRAFGRQLGTTPSHYRARFRGNTNQSMRP